jgi:hypothetical protein
VLRQISEPRPSLFARLFGQPFGQRTLTYAAAFSLLVCAAVFTSHLLRRSPTPSVEVSKEDKGGPGQAETNDTRKSGPQTQGGMTANANQVAIAASTPRPKPVSRRSVRQAREGAKASAPEEKFVSPSSRPDGEQTASVPGVQTRVAAVPSGPEPKASDAGSPKHPETAAADREMFRIELQTKDPNVRIIWLSPRQTTDGDSPNQPTDKR